VGLLNKKVENPPVEFIDPDKLYPNDHVMSKFALNALLIKKLQEDSDILII
jgi:hypothetical protein